MVEHYLEFFCVLYRNYSWLAVILAVIMLTSPFYTDFSREEQSNAVSNGLTIGITGAVSLITYYQFF